MQARGTLHGKLIFAYDPKLECEESDVEKYLAGFKRLDALRTLCNYMPKASECSNSIMSRKGIPLPDDIFSDAVHRVLRYTSVLEGKSFTEDDFLLLMRMCHKLFDKSLEATTTNPSEILMKLGYRQFTNQENPFNLLARNIYIYMHLWQTIDRARGLDVLREIEAAIGVSYKFAIAITMALIGRQENYFFPWTKETIECISKPLGIESPEESFENFLDWCSNDYSFYQDNHGLLSPITLFPIIRTMEKPTEDKKEVYIIASEISLFQKITSGIYFSLIDRFNAGKGRNDFKTKYGYVFEAYVGRLLTEHLKGLSVLPEIKYRKNKNEIDSADWFVKDADRLLIIEVKQSSIFLEAKISASLSDIKNDLKKTLIKAAKQLDRTRSDIESEKYQEFSHLKGIKEFHSLIVTSDPLYNANYIGKQLIADEIGINTYYDIINITDLENLLSSLSESSSIFDILAYKKLDDIEMDFNEFLIKLYPNATGNMTFLEKYYDELFAQYKEKRKYNTI